jgi:transposase-like protein
VSVPVTEADETYQKAGEKGIPRLDPAGPPRRRANRFNGHGTFANDRPPVVGAIGRETGAVALLVADDSTRRTLHGFVVDETQADCVVTTDEWPAYDQRPRTGRTHRTVHHGKRGDREWARDDDGDGVREVHCTTMEGFWTGLRNFLRPFRGVSKWFLAQYVALYAALHNYSALPALFLRALLGPSGAFT